MKTREQIEELIFEEFRKKTIRLMMLCRYEYTNKK